MFAVRGEKVRRLGHIRGVPLAEERLGVSAAVPGPRFSHRERECPACRPLLPALEASAFLGKLQSSGQKTGREISDFLCRTLWNWPKLVEPGRIMPWSSRQHCPPEGVMPSLH